MIKRKLNLLKSMKKNISSGLVKIVRNISMIVKDLIKKLENFSEEKRLK